MKHVIKAAALMSSMALFSSMAMADHHEGDMSAEGHGDKAHDMSEMNGNSNKDDALVEDGGVQSDYNAERADTGGKLDDEPIVKDGGTMSDYNAEVPDDSDATLPEGEIAEDSGTDSGN